MRYLCTICSYVYDPKIGDREHSVVPGTEFHDIPGDWVCPICAASKDQFEEIPE